MGIFSEFLYRMQVSSVTFVASSLSAIALISCLLVLSSVYRNVQDYWTELDDQMVEVRVSSTDFFH